ncbi:type I polyketide synthase [Nocardia cyriacigeorgica]|uniref:type I polyketide synthase n=1 Tax=Nocardia cyriacigeorgica TaxID=135487 RepID=UPI0018959836|nr:type I polyketide synthase [Nocardia cyriacigeorgica]MBF6416320.1 type I polyketide synthase [Nocardia cyriacigeorgica]
MTDHGDPGTGGLIAIVGMDCRFPGADDPDEYWKLLSEGRHVSHGLPTERGWDLGRVYNEDPAVEGTTYIQRGGFLRNIGDFDASLFGIGPREATTMDPQQRMLLESTWLALERARSSPRSLSNVRSGVYVGATDSYYGLAGARIPGLERHLLMGTMLSATSGRIAYALGLTGPAITVDTACSSALVAVHLAVRALRSGECDVTIVGGATAICDPSMLARYSRHRVLSVDGFSRGFSADGNGFAPAEGVASLILMPLERAQLLGKPVLAVIRGSAVNEDGASATLQAPNGRAQQAVIAAALDDAGLLPQQIGAIEAHGPGTPLGDATEAATLQAGYARHHSTDDPVWVGSVKSNIGHTLAAAGLAGLVKMVLALQHERLPATLHVENPLAGVDWTTGGMRLLRRSRPWPRTTEPRRAGVLSYGITGTNAHVILEEAPVPSVVGHRRTRRREPSPLRRPIPMWPLYAASPSALVAQAAALAAHVRSNGDLSEVDLSWSLGTTRSALTHRAVITGSAKEELVARLAEFATEAPAPLGVAVGKVRHGPGPVFIFPGQGSQWVGMGDQLLADSPVFARSMERCAEALRPYLNFDVIGVLRGEGSAHLERAEVIQPLLFAMYVSLAELWQSLGVGPAAVIGHSQGEIAAAHVAGALTLDEAARVVALRSAALRAVGRRGAMASVAMPADRTRESLCRWSDRLDVAVVNGPSATVVAGDAEAMTEYLRQCRQLGVETRLLPVDYASHSEHMETLRDRILADLAGITSRPARVPVISSTTGEIIDSTGLDASYWYENLRRTVHFDKAIHRALTAGYRQFVEISPHPVLTGAIAEIASTVDIDAGVSGTLQRGRGGGENFLAAVADAHAHGAEVDWAALYPGAREVDLPTYSLQRRFYWLPAASTAPTMREGAFDIADHPLITATTDLSDGGMVCVGHLEVKEHPWLADHKVFDQVIMPATVTVDVLTWCASRAGGSGVQDLVLSSPLPLTDAPIDIQVMCGPVGQDGRRRLTLHSRNRGDKGPWRCHAEATTIGTVAMDPGDDLEGGTAGQAWPPQGSHPVSVDGCYRVLQGKGYDYGVAFQNLTAAWSKDSTLYVEVRGMRRQPARTEGFAVHPALLDSILHALLLTGSGQGTVVPSSLGCVRILPRRTNDLRATISPAGQDRYHVRVTDPDGKAVADFYDLLLRPVTRRGFRGMLATTARHAYRLHWRSVDSVGRSDGDRSRWAVVGTQPDLPGADVHPDARALSLALRHGRDVPEVVLLDLRSTTPKDELPDEAVLRERLSRLMDDAQTLLSDELLHQTLIVGVTRRAHSTSITESAPDAIGAACAGMMRSVSTEHPGRVRLIDLDAGPVDHELMFGALATDHPQMALRGAQALIPRLTPAADSLLRPPAVEQPWRLVRGRDKTLDNVTAAPAPDLTAPLEPDQVRIRVLASGVNFRDPLVALGMLDETALGFEVSGAVVEVGEQVGDVQLGARVAAVVLHTGSRPGAYGPSVVVDRRAILTVPTHWSHAQAAGTPIVFLTAYHALVELAEVKPGMRVLIHSAAGGVGMAAVQIAAMLGAEIYATASPSKQGVVEATGIPRERIADSRTLEFEYRFTEATGGTGIDVVLGSLAGEAVDASLRLLRPGGIYLEMGRTDLRDPAAVTAGHPEITYDCINIAELPMSRVADILGHLQSLFADGQLSPLPVRTWSIGHAREVLRYLSHGHSTGKLVLTQPAELRPEETVLITGGTGSLGRLLARHLVTAHGCRHLLLASRQGDQAAAARELATELGEMGAEVTLAACDVADRAALSTVIRGIPPRHPLGAVVHAAGTLDDCLFTDLTPDRLWRVLEPKAIAARHLHELTADMNLRAFVMYSSIANVVGTSGQANYAAANAFLDALAHHRHSIGLPATSIAWGLWQQSSALTSHLDNTDLARLARQGLAPLDTAGALAVFDMALEQDEPCLAATALSSVGPDTPLAAVLAELPRQHTPSPAGDGSSSAAQDLPRPKLVGLPPSERVKALTTLIRTHAAVVLGHQDPDALAADRTFRDAGFDSLSNVELRTRLSSATGVRLTIADILDHPTPTRLAVFINEALVRGNGSRPLQLP